jgi:hypothetical protein
MSSSEIAVDRLPAFTQSLHRFVERGCDLPQCIAAETVTFPKVYGSARTVKREDSFRSGSDDMHMRGAMVIRIDDNAQAPTLKTVGTASPYQKPKRLGSHLRVPRDRGGHGFFHDERPVFIHPQSLPKKLIPVDVIKPIFFSARF